MRPFRYERPHSLAEAISLLEQWDGRAWPLAGGTDLVVQMQEAGLRPACIISLNHIPDLRGITFTPGGGLRLGALTTMDEIVHHPDVRVRYPVLVDGASVIGSQQIRNMATLGGNLCNAAPSADTAPPLLVLDAVAVIAGPEGERRVPVHQFFTGPGETVLGRGELLVAVELPPPAAGFVAHYRRHTPRAWMDIAVVGVAAGLVLDGDGVVTDARVALGAVAPTPIRSARAETVLRTRPLTEEVIQAAAAAAAQDARPISDIRASADYRRHLVEVLTRRVLRFVREPSGR